MTPDIPFTSPPSDLRLADDEIHIFCAPLDQPPSRTEQVVEFLSNDEHARATRFRFEKDRGRFITGRGMLREILGWLLQIEPARLTFSYGVNGKPQLMSPSGGRVLHFNLAHSDGLAVYALASTQEVGVDVERIRPIPDMELMVEQFLSKHEVARWHSLSNGQRLEAFFNAWTCKEAHLKAIGEGLNDRLAQVEVPCISDKPEELSWLAPDSRQDAGWFLRSIMFAPDYVGAVAAKNRAARISCWQWQR